MRLFCWIAGLLISILPAGAATRRPVDVSPLLKMSIDEVAAQVPLNGGIYYIGCPHCDGGAQEEGVLEWRSGMGDTVRCRHCNTVFPNAQYPNNKQHRFTDPTGRAVVYRYYEGPTGRQYFLEAHAWFMQMRTMRSYAASLADNFAKNRDLNSADRAAAILARFAQVVPNYAVRYDYPFKPKIFYPADQKWPYKGIPSYRGCKFDNWGYVDIPEDLGRAYKALQDGNYDWSRLGGKFGKDPNALVRNDLLKLLVDFTAANDEMYSNMSPRVYRGMITFGRMLDEPKYVHQAVVAFRELIRRNFFADGWWKEGTPSYHSQTVGNLESDAAAALGYSDPPGWTGEKFENLDLAKEVPILARARRITKEYVLPDGREIPINDTWARGGGNRQPRSGESPSRLWPGLGQALLGAGSDANQICLGLNWSGNYGHSHTDNGSIFLYAFGKEMLPDVGYTHTRWRNYTINSVSHNLVVVDERSQSPTSSTQGNLLWFDATHPHVRAIDLDAQPAYPNVKTYRRRLALVHAAEGFDYVIDRFDVESGKTHDLFVHGSADDPAKFETSIPITAAVASLVPSWGGQGAYVGETDTDQNGAKFHAYWFLKEISSAASRGVWNATWTYGNSGLRAHMIPPEGATLYRYMSPMIRPAGSNDANLSKYMTPGIMQRHAGPKSKFVTVHEPFSASPWIESVKGDAEILIVKYSLNGNSVTDTIAIGDGALDIHSSAGWSYTTGKPVSGSVAAIESKAGKCTVKLDRPAPETKAVRLNFGPRRSFVFPVEKADGNNLELAVDTGIVMDSADSAHFVAFPHEKLSGKITWTVYRGTPIS